MTRFPGSRALRVSLAVTFLGISMRGIAAAEEPEVARTLVGQVTCSQCWGEADRIGTPFGTAYFMTIAKDLESVVGWPIAPYVGVSYGTFDETLRAIGGLRARFGRGVSIQAIYDGVNLHPSVEVNLPGDHTLSFLWVETEMFGVAYSLAF